jgi:predicted short-subunit dehydrogenase-like oxidoreductase (DUF2520 family)
VTETDIPSPAPLRAPLPLSVGVVGAGRLGTALADGLRGAGLSVAGPARRGTAPAGEAILLCVPDDEIPSAAAALAGSAPFVGHTSGATPLAALAPAADAGAETFGLHPLQTFAADGPAASRRFAGVGCAISGSCPRARSVADALARTLGMEPFELDDADRAAYHAAASIASNFLITLEAAAERLAGSAGLAPDEARRLLTPLVRSTVENWSELGPERALTGPIARGDTETVARQRAAIKQRSPDLLGLFDALVEQTWRLASRGVPA